MMTVAHYVNIVEINAGIDSKERRNKNASAERRTRLSLIIKP